MSSGVQKGCLVSNFRIVCGLGSKIASPAHLPGQAKGVSGPQLYVVDIGSAKNFTKRNFCNILS